MQALRHVVSIKPPQVSLLAEIRISSSWKQLETTQSSRINKQMLHHCHIRIIIIIKIYIKQYKLVYVSLADISDL